MNRIRLWLLALAILAIASGGSVGWPGILDAPGTPAAGPVAVVVTVDAAPGGFARGQRW